MMPNKQRSPKLLWSCARWRMWTCGWTVAWGSLAWGCTPTAGAPADSSTAAAQSAGAAPKPCSRPVDSAGPRLEVTFKSDDKVWKTNDKGERESWQTACYYSLEDLPAQGARTNPARESDFPVSRMSFSCSIRVPRDNRMSSSFCSAYFQKFQSGVQSIYVRNYVNSCAEARVLNARANSIPFTEAGFSVWLEKNYFDICARHVFYLDPETGQSAVVEAKGYDFKSDVVQLIERLVRRRSWSGNGPAEAPPTTEP